MEKQVEKYKAFTLAEILITLVIIGIVSALVIPSVLKNYNDQKYNTARLKALKTFGEAGKLASINGEINGQPDATAFVNNVLSKYLKVTKLCRRPGECNFPFQVKGLNPTTNYTHYDPPCWACISGNYFVNTNTNNADRNLSTYIMTGDGFSAVLLYNPNCANNAHDYTSNCNYNECLSRASDKICINVIYDMNGQKGPNQTGKDIGFVTVFWSGIKATAVAPGMMPYDMAKEIFDEGFKTQAQASEACASKSTNKIQYSLPNLYELLSLGINWYYTGTPNDVVWTGSPVSDRPGYIWVAGTAGFYQDHRRLQDTRKTWCVRR